MSQSPRGLPLPWLSLWIAGLCVAATLWGEARHQDVKSGVEASLVEAEAYHRRNPDTHTRPLLAARMGTEAVPRGAEGLMSSLAARQQAGLDEILAPAEAAYERLPALHYALRASEPSVLALFSYPFIHPGDAQGVLAVLLLIVLGLQFEPVLGRFGYGLSLLAGGLGAGFGYLEAATVDASPLAGATGCLAGALAAYGVRCGREAIEGVRPLVVLLALAAILGPALVEGRWLVAPLIAEPAPLPLGTTASILLGGMLGGVLGMGVARAMGMLPAPVSNPQTADQDVRRALAARARGRRREAYALLENAVARRPDDSDAVVALWDVAGELGRRGDVRAALLHVVREETRRGELEVAASHWLDLAEAGVPEEAEASLLVTLALQLQRMKRPDAMIEALLAALERPEGHAPALAGRVAKLSGKLDPDLTQKAAWRALASPDISLAERQALEDILAEVVEPVRIWAHDRAVAEKDDHWKSPLARPILDLDLTERFVDVVYASPSALRDGVLELSGTGRKLSLGRIEAIGVAAVQGLAARPVVIIDLVLNWRATSRETLQVVRLRSDRFDPLRLVDSDDRAEALRAFLSRLLEASAAQPIPDAPAVLGQPFASFETLDAYQQTVLMVDGLVPERAR